MRLSRFYKNRPQLIVLFALTLAIVNELWTNVLFFCGVATSDPLALEEEAIVRSVYTDSALNRGDDTKKNISWITRTNESKSIIRLAAYDEVSLYHKDQSSTTTPLWDVYPSDKDVSIGRLSSNATSCFGGGIFGSVHCLPSFLILGFEKCGTTVRSKINISMNVACHITCTLLLMRWVDGIIWIDILL